MKTVRPPGPRTWFGFSEMAKMKADLLGYHEGLQKQYGDIVSQRIGPYWMYNLYHPDHIRELLVTHAKKFHKFERTVSVFAQWNGASMLITEDDVWLRKRRLAQPAFSTKRFTAYGALMTGFAARLRDRWHAQGQAEVEITKSMTDLTLEIIAKTLFDADIAGDTAELGRAVAILSEVAFRELQEVATWPDWLPLESKRRKRWAMKLLDDTVWRFVRQRRASGEDRGDLLSMLLLAVDEDGAGRLSDLEARNESMTLFLAGHDTSAAGLAWTWYLLAKHPEMMRRAQAEVDAAVGAARLPAFDDLPKLLFIEHVVKESLRLYPPAIGVFMRRAIDDVQIGDYKIPRGSLIQPISWVTHRDERWFPEPRKFDPDRWQTDRAAIIPPGAWYAFGAGPRACIGQSFAMLEMTLVVATLLQTLSVEIAPNQSEPEPQALMSLRPKGGLRVRWTARQTVSTGKT